MNFKIADDKYHVESTSIARNEWEVKKEDMERQKCQ